MSNFSRSVQMLDTVPRDDQNQVELQDSKVEVKGTPRSETRMRLYEPYQARKTSKIVQEWMNLGKKKSMPESKC